MHVDRFTAHQLGLFSVVSWDVDQLGLFSVVSWDVDQLSLEDSLNRPLLDPMQVFGV